MSACKPTARPSDRRRAQAGFSLLELFIVLSLLVLFGMAIQDTVVLGVRAANATNERETVRREVATALDRFTREVSMADVVDVANDQRCQFDADIDGNGSVDNNINYRVNSGDLQRVFGGRTLTLIPDLGSMEFDYMDIGGTTYDDYGNDCSGCPRANIRIVQITVTATRGNETITAGSAASLRNNF